MDAQLHSLIHFEMGRIYDKQEQHEAAFISFEKASKTQTIIYAASGATIAQSSTHLHTMNAIDLDRVKDTIARSPSPEAHIPAVLIDFPCSGTTLLHQLLEAHPHISVLEEHPITYSIQKDFGLHQAGYQEALYALNDNTIIALRKKYLDAVGALTRKNSATLTVDKLPLNILTTPLIKVLFQKRKSSWPYATLMTPS